MHDMYQETSANQHFAWMIVQRKVTSAAVDISFKNNRRKYVVLSPDQVGIPNKE